MVPWLALLLPALAAAEAPAKPPERLAFVFLGDSLTAGFGLAPEDAYPQLLSERWAREGLPFRARNAGVSGSTTAGALENLDWVLGPDVRVLFVCLGANDGLRGLPVKEARANLARIIRRAKAAGATVVLAGMKLPSNYGEAYRAAFEAMYPSLAKEHKLKLLPFLLEGVALSPELNLPDGLHPNAAGHRVMAGTVHSFLDREGLLEAPR